MRKMKFEKGINQVLQVTSYGYNNISLFVNICKANTTTIASYHVYRSNGKSRYMDRFNREKLQSETDSEDYSF